MESDDREAPSDRWRIASYPGRVLVTPLATCAGCGQLVLYRTQSGEIVMADACGCDPDD